MRNYRYRKNGNLFAALFVYGAAVVFGMLAAEQTSIRPLTWLHHHGILRVVQ